MKLKLGCGKDYIDDWVNVDFYDDSKCDVTHDLEEFPWPWEDDSVSEIEIIHTLEHLGADWKVYYKILQEMYRICEDDAHIQVEVPSPWHWNNISDPTHVRPVTPDGLNLFSKEHCQKCIDEGMSETPFAMIYNVDLRPHDVVWKYDQLWQGKISLAVVKSEESAKKHTYEHKLHLPGGEIPSKTESPSNIVRS